MKRVILFSLGLIPFVVGFLMHSWLMENQDSILPTKLIGIVFLIVWIFIGFITGKYEETPLKSAAIINLPAFLTLLLSMYQLIILEQYWNNMLGLVTQFYYFPLYNISAYIGYFLPFITFKSGTISLISFLIMFASYYFGCYLRKIRNV